MSFIVSGDANTNYRIHENDIESKILGFLELTNGWHYGDGVPPKFKTVAKALKISDIAQLHGIDIDASPGVNGEIEVDCYNCDDTLEFTIEENDKVTYVFERAGQEDEHTENLSIEQATDIFSDYINKICNISEPYTETTSIEEGKDLEVWRSRIPLMVAEFRWFLCHA